MAAPFGDKARYIGKLVPGRNVLWLAVEPGPAPLRPGRCLGLVRRLHKRSSHDHVHAVRHRGDRPQGLAVAEWIAANRDKIDPWIEAALATA